ncbi:MAG: Gfo/Idh/MocA family oxidoreductase [Holophagaceae bacterium]|nr:Gfo/Idh/MocA family oxidoreductase [Holophagaceae bacterium]
MDKNNSRRDFLAAMGGLALGATQLHSLPLLGSGGREPLRLDSPTTAVVIGHGSRGGLYSRFSRQLENIWKIVGVAEPIDYRREAATQAYEIPSSQTFTTWEHVFRKPKFADVCIISTPDDLHYGPAMAALEAGYDLLLEKPIAMTWQQCKSILELANRKQAIVCVCHVLRYAPYFVELKKVIQDGSIGDVVSIQHMEPISHMHMSHSYVRGIWRNTKTSLPIILAKSCHDLDLLRWYVDKPYTSVSCLGDRSVFRPERAPAGATQYCMDGCPAAKQCPYYAPDVYVHKKKWGSGAIITPDRSEAGLLEALRKGPYGKCVFKNDNNQPDHQVMSFGFKDGVTATFSMEAMTSYEGRRTRVMGTKGDIVGDEHILQIANFETGQKREWDVRQPGSDLSGHGGGDLRMVREFATAVAKRDPSLLATNLKDSMESHLAGFQAEASRLEGGVLKEIKM